MLCIVPSDKTNDVTRVTIDVEDEKWYQTWRLSSKSGETLANIRSNLRHSLIYGWDGTLGDGFGNHTDQGPIEGQAGAIVAIDHDGIEVDMSVDDDFHAKFVPPPILPYTLLHNGYVHIPRAAEGLNLSRNIVTVNGHFLAGYVCHTPCISRRIKSETDKK
eukprot:CAMPEP_0171302866 /NCGR_PEP_ID=MMETSP0816-20121228/12336_1 /TAXON_ID=420281 /ORGANISM="Proboscia inermis, Strain CCAP1064/1" /LENGTH=160 /DNA_ID=CAMNT_0011781679 /DNA_START=159 /DNA_END=640 /DNA_ORIENTATION=-